MGDEYEGMFTDALFVRNTDGKIFYFDEAIRQICFGRRCRDCLFTTATRNWPSTEAPGVYACGCVEPHYNAQATISAMEEYGYYLMSDGELPNDIGETELSQLLNF